MRREPLSEEARAGPAVCRADAEPPALRWPLAPEMAPEA